MADSRMAHQQARRDRQHAPAQLRRAQQRAGTERKLPAARAGAAAVGHRPVGRLLRHIAGAAARANRPVRPQPLFPPAAGLLLAGKAPQQMPGGGQRAAARLSLFQTHQKSPFAASLPVFLHCVTVNWDFSFTLMRKRPSEPHTGAGTVFRAPQRNAADVKKNGLSEPLTAKRRIRKRKPRRDRVSGSSAR